MQIGLEGKRALVGGGSQGIGRATAHELASLGASVTLLSRNEERLRNVARHLPAPYDQRHDFLAVDFDAPEKAAEAVEKWSEKAGDVNILVNNSGGPPGGPIADATIEEFMSALRSHLFASQLLVQAVLPGMKASGYGRIINIISVSVRQPIPGLGVSNTTRGAMASWSKTLSIELAPDGITVNNVLPGMTGTDRLFSLLKSRAAAQGTSDEVEQAAWLGSIPMGRFADPEEIGRVIAFLASPAASYITGTSLPVDGGFIGAI